MIRRKVTLSAGQKTEVKSRSSSRGLGDNGTGLGGAGAAQTNLGYLSIWGLHCPFLEATVRQRNEACSCKAQLSPHLPLWSGYIWRASPVLLNPKHLTWKFCAFSDSGGLSGAAWMGSLKSSSRKTMPARTKCFFQTRSGSCTLCSLGWILSALVLCPRERTFHETACSWCSDRFPGPLLLSAWTSILSGLTLLFCQSHSPQQP